MAPSNATDVRAARPQNQTARALPFQTSTPGTRYAERVRSSPRDRAIERLGLDPLRHIVGLKMLQQVGGAADVALREDAAGWAALISFSSSAFEYDAQNYGLETRIAVVEGTSEALQLELLDGLEGQDAVLKTQNPHVVRRARERFEARAVGAFVSFTSDERSALPNEPPSSAGHECSTSTTLSPTLAAIFERNGYREAELARHFAAGARWFALERDGAVAAACFVFQNFGRVWEIAGVHTEPSQRRRGLAARVVGAALAHLLAAGALPRYQTSAANEASLALARSIGLVEFLRIEHLKVEPRRERAQDGSGCRLPGS
jgi:RimJ/RimL family protein N-acetyltransferase